MISLALLLIGFSLFSALVIALSHFTPERYREYRFSRAMGIVLLVALAGLQSAHFAWLYLDEAWVLTWPYRVALFAVAPAFFLYCRPLLSPQLPSVSLRHLAHAVPVMAFPWLPGAVALPLAFVIGAGYLVWLARSLYALRRERENFRVEIILLGTVFAVAIGVSVLGLVQVALPEKLFFSLYAISIGLAFLLVQTVLGLRPQLSSEVSETVRAAYAVSTLNSVDCDAVLTRLDALMRDERLYTSADLGLAELSGRLDLSSHQLSELINTRLGKSFSRYLREQRVDAARVMLCDEPSASVLSVGLSVGFSSQSNFYEAFREIVGMTPGQYRKLQGKAGTARPSK